MCLNVFECKGCNHCTAAVVVWISHEPLRSAYQCLNVHLWMYIHWYIHTYICTYIWMNEINWYTFVNLHLQKDKRERKRESKQKKGWEMIWYWINNSNDKLWWRFIVWQRAYCKLQTANCILYVVQSKGKVNLDTNVCNSLLTYYMYRHGLLSTPLHFLLIDWLIDWFFLSFLPSSAKVK